MPKMKNRGTEGRNESVPRLIEAMGLGRRGASKIHAATDEIKPVHDNLNKTGGKRQSKKGFAQHGAHDVKTRVFLPSAKGGKKGGRASTKKGS